MKNKFVSIIIKILIVAVVIALAIFSGYIYSNAESENSNETDKVEKEIDYLDTQITGLINKLNRYTTRKLQNFYKESSRIKWAGKFKFKISFK